MSASKPRKNKPQRSEGKTATSISMSQETLNRAKEAAQQDGRTLSNWIEQLIKNSVKLIVWAFTIQTDTIAIRRAGGSPPHQFP